MKYSAALLLYRYAGKEIQILLVHPGGPFWKNKDSGVWSLPKGEIAKSEDPLDAAIKEFTEETGLTLPPLEYTELQPVMQNKSKKIYARAAEIDLDVSNITSNIIEIDWPPRSGKKLSVSEVDRAGWFNLKETAEKIIPGQFPLIEQLVRLLSKTNSNK